jgi:hypothetical protein
LQLCCSCCMPLTLMTQAPIGNLDPRRDQWGAYIPGMWEHAGADGGGGGLQVLTFLALLVQKYKYCGETSGARTYRACGSMPALTAGQEGCRFTCFTSTKVQILTHKPQGI